MIKKFKNTLIILILLISILHVTFYFTTKSMVKAEQSINPKATMYYIHANVISTLWIENIHKYLMIDYDSILMIPLLGLVNELFEKGEKYTSPNNAEAGVWWFLTYAYIYNINTPSREDSSMDIYELPKDEEIKLRYKLANYILALNNIGVKGVVFGKYESSAMHAFFGTHFSMIDWNKHYNEKSEAGRNYAYWHDTKLYNKRVLTYKAYKKFSDRDAFLDGWELYSLKNIVGTLRYFIKRNVSVVNKKYKINCNNRYIVEFLEKIQDSIEARKRNQNNSIPNIIAREDFKKMAGNLMLLKIIKDSCMLYSQEAYQIEKKLKKINMSDNPQIPKETSRSISKKSL